MVHRILSFDGGGVRGAFSARVISRLESAAPLLDSVDLFAGTSTGAIIALGLAAGFQPGQVVELYLKNAARIFADPVPWLGELRELAEPKYSDAGRLAVLRETFGELRLGQLLRDVLVVAYDTVGARPVLFTRARYPQLTLVDAAMASSAAPVYFPQYGPYIDGGVCANDPALAGAALAVSDGAELADVRVLSVGTGSQAPAFKCDGWGGLQWFERDRLIDTLCAGPMLAAQDQLAQLLDGHYFRLDGAVDCALDETRDLEARLLAPANAVDLEAAKIWVELFFNSKKEFLK